MSRRSRGRRANGFVVAKAGSGTLDPMDGSILGTIQGGDGVYKTGPSASTMEQYWYLFSKHPWVSTCVSLIAEAVAAESFTVAPIDGASGDSINDKDDPRVGDIHTFFEHCTPGSTFAALRLSTAIDLRVFNLSYWRKKRAVAGGLPLFLERLDPRRVTAKLTADRTAIEAFYLRKGTSDNIVDQTTPPEKIPAEDVVFFKMHGGDPLFGPPAPLEALDLTISEDWLIRRHRSAFFRNGGVSGRVIQIAGVNEQQAENMTKRLRSNKIGADAAFQDLVIPGNGVTIHESSATTGKRDSDFIKGSEMLRDEIFAVFKVPPGKVFINSGALGSAGKTVDDDTFQRDAVLPVERVIYETITREILANEFDIQDLKLIPSRMSQIRLEMFPVAEQLTHFGGTGNEARALVNLPPIDGEDTDMDRPLFITARNPLAQQESTAVDDDPDEDDGDVTDVDDQIDETDKTASAPGPKTTSPKAPQKKTKT